MVGFFTWHAYKSWMPDRDQGYVRRGEGILSPDVEMADQYGRHARVDGVLFRPPIQRQLIDAVLTATTFQRLRLHGVGTDLTHLHVLVSWTDDRELAAVRTGLRSSITRHLNKTFGRRTWLSSGGSIKRVSDAKHLDYLLHSYIPKHVGLKWREDAGFYH